SNDDDCDHTRASVHPGAPEVVADGIDQNCDGVDTCYHDADGDGFGSGALIDDTDLVCSNSSAPTSDVSGDCNDVDPRVHPGAPELCNGVDDDCDGAVDDAPIDIDTWYADADG